MNFAPELNLALRKDLPGVPAVQNNLRALSSFVLSAQTALNIFSDDGCHTCPTSPEAFMTNLNSTLTESFLTKELEAADAPLRKELARCWQEVLAHVQIAQEMMSDTYLRPHYSRVLPDIQKEAWPRLNGFVQAKIREAIDLTAQFIVKPWTGA